MSWMYEFISSVELCYLLDTTDLWPGGVCRPATRSPWWAQVGVSCKSPGTRWHCSVPPLSWRTRRSAPPCNRTARLYLIQLQYSTLPYHTIFETLIIQEKYKLCVKVTQLCPCFLYPHPPPLPWKQQPKSPFLQLVHADFEIPSLPIRSIENRMRLWRHWDSIVESGCPRWLRFGGLTGEKLLYERESVYYSKVHVLQCSFPWLSSSIFLLSWLLSYFNLYCLLLFS